MECNIDIVGKYSTNYIYKNYTMVIKDCWIPLLLHKSKVEPRTNINPLRPKFIWLRILTPENRY